MSYLITELSESEMADLGKRRGQRQNGNIGEGDKANGNIKKEGGGGV